MFIQNNIAENTLKYDDTRIVIFNMIMTQFHEVFTDGIFGYVNFL